MITPKFPDVEVQLSGESDNVFAIIGRVSKALRGGGATSEEIQVFQNEATRGNYDNALQTCMRWVVVS